MRGRFGLRRYAGLLTILSCTAAALVLAVPGALGSGAAAYTTAIDDGSGNPAGCQNGHGINCNIYDSKSDVYVNGGPTQGAGLPAGTYYFAVLVPGYQNGGFVDGSGGNLSDGTSSNDSKSDSSQVSAGNGDSYLCRELTVSSNGTVTYTPAAGCTTGSHQQGIDVQGSTVTQLMPYDDTTNNGGVYIMAICKVGATSSKDCKFDAFKVRGGETHQPTDLVVTKDATPSFTRTYNWNVAKTRTSTSPVRTSSSTVSVGYKVTAAWSGPQDSGWELDGSISVLNPNTFDVANVDVSDAVDDGGLCAVTDGSSQTIPAETTVSFSYTCSYAAQPDPNPGTNTATATWDKDAYGTPTGSATFDIPFTFDDGSLGNPTVVNLCDTVTDSFNGASAITLGAVCANGTSSGLYTGNSPLSSFTSGYGSPTWTFTYNRTVSVDPNGCTTYPNTAAGTVDSNPNDNSASVTTCPTVGGLTIGYWQNKNGQSRITGAGQITVVDGSGSHANVCRLTGSLRAYAPFQDLGQYSTCAQVATYVYNLIKAATCTSSTKTCNSMLKAQMLAAALNVYFLVTNGSEQIDLVHGCAMIDSTSGTATCSGSENWSAAFGGATHLSVAGMLSYAASQSNSGGSTWYGNVKATQVLAKDAFDAINNSVALAY